MSDQLAAVELLKLVLAQRPSGDVLTKEQIFELYWDCLKAIKDRRPDPAQPGHSE